VNLQYGFYQLARLHPGKNELFICVLKKKRVDLVFLFVPQTRPVNAHRDVGFTRVAMFGRLVRWYRALYFREYLTEVEDTIALRRYFFSSVFRKN